MANTEKESLSISELLKMREKISEVIVDTIAGFISHPLTLILCSGIICYTMHQSGYGVLAILTFIFGMWCICPVLGWIIRSDNSDRDGFYEVICGSGGACAALLCIFIAVDNGQNSATYDPFNPADIYKTTRIERIIPTTVTRSDNMIVLVHDTLVIKSNKIEDFTSKNPIMCVKHYINSFKVEQTTSPKVCGE